MKDQPNSIQLSANILALATFLLLLVSGLLIAGSADAGHMGEKIVIHPSGAQTFYYKGDGVRACDADGKTSSIVVVQPSGQDINETTDDGSCINLVFNETGEWTFRTDNGETGRFRVTDRPDNRSPEQESGFQQFTNLEGLEFLIFPLTSVLGIWIWSRSLDLGVRTFGATTTLISGIMLIAYALETGASTLWEGLITIGVVTSLTGAYMIVRQFIELLTNEGQTMRDTQ